MSAETFMYTTYHWYTWYYYEQLTGHLCMQDQTNVSPSACSVKQPTAVGHKSSVSATKVTQTS